MRIIWSEEEEEILKKLAEKNVLLDKVAEVLGRSESSVRAKLSALGLKIPQAKTTINYELYRELLGTVEEI